MTTYAILVKDKIAAQHDDSKNRSAYLTSASLANGCVFYLNTLAGLSGCEVWTVTKSNGSAADMWMAYSSDVNLVEVGTKKFRGITADAADFYISACTVFSAFRPEPGDIITMTAEGFSNAVSTNTYANSADNQYTLAWGTSKSASALSFKLLDATYISKPDGSLGDDQRVTAFKLVCVGNPVAQ